MQSWMMTGRVNFPNWLQLSKMIFLICRGQLITMGALWMTTVLGNHHRFSDLWKLAHMLGPGLVLLSWGSGHLRQSLFT